MADLSVFKRFLSPFPTRPEEDLLEDDRGERRSESLGIHVVWAGKDCEEIDIDWDQQTKCEKKNGQKKRRKSVVLCRLELNRCLEW